MNKGIHYRDICDRMERHTTESMNEFDFETIFPELSYHARRDTPDAMHVGDWFHVAPEHIWQISAYGKGAGRILLLIEPILSFVTADGYPLNTSL